MNPGVLSSHRDLLFRGLIALSLAVLVYRVYACFQVPTVTSDVLRNLGYARHALEQNFGLYNTIGTDFTPESWTLLAWRQFTFQYPPVTLLFFHVFSVLDLGIFWVKLVLTALEVFCCYLFYQRVSKVAALLFFCAPISWWFTSHEGQFEALLTFLVILVVIAIDAKRWVWAGILFALAIQTKQFAIFLGPWLAYRIWTDTDSLAIHQRITQFSLGVVLGFAPFLGYYLQRPDLLLIPLYTARELTGGRNPFNILSGLSQSSNKQYLLLSAWHTAFSLLAIAVLLGSLLFKHNRKIAHIFSLVPLVSFVAFLQSSSVARLWYPMVGPGLVHCLSRSKTLVTVYLGVYLLQGLPIVLAVVQGNHMLIWGHVERQAILDVMRSCMFTCDFK